MEASKYLPKWRKTVAEAARQAVGDDFQLIPKPVEVVMQLDFVLPRPKSTPKNQLHPSAAKRPDLDKLARAILDSLTGVIYEDDCQVVDMQVTKVVGLPGEPPGVYATIK